MRMLAQRKSRKALSFGVESIESRILLSTTLAVWNFNDAATAAPYPAANTANLLSVDRVTAGITASLTTTVAAANITSFAGTTVNADPNFTPTDTSGASFVVQPGTSNVNNGTNLTAAVTTTGYSNIVVSFATQKTSTGFVSDQFQYSVDGTTFVNFGTAYNPATVFATQTFDLSSITALNNDANAAFRVIFNGGTAATGNNRIDNLLVIGTQGTGPGTPVIGSFTLSPTTVSVDGGTLTLSANNVTEINGAGIASGVNFYLDSDGNPGLQIASDTLVGPGVQSGTNFVLANVSTGGLTVGTHIYYAVATDNNGTSSAFLGPAYCLKQPLDWIQYRDLYGQRKRWHRDDHGNLEPRGNFQYDNRLCHQRRYALHQRCGYQC